MGRGTLCDYIYIYIFHTHFDEFPDLEDYMKSGTLGPIKKVS